jgi:transposase
MAIVEVTRPVVGGVDTHLDVHVVAAAVDPIGGLLGVESFPTTVAGYHALAGWLESFGPIERVGVEGTGTYGAGLARHLAAAGIAVFEVDRPNRQERRRNGKSDELDAIEAARAALSGRARGHAKGGTGNVESLRALLVAKRSARSIRIRTTGQLRHLVVTAPDDLRAGLHGLTTTALVADAAALRARPIGEPVRHATKTAISSLARRACRPSTPRSPARRSHRHRRAGHRTCPARRLRHRCRDRRPLARRRRRQRQPHPLRSRLGARLRSRTDSGRVRHD